MKTSHCRQSEYLNVANMHVPEGGGIEAEEVGAEEVGAGEFKERAVTRRA